MISAIVLAAGLSSRMKGENKLLLRLGDKTIIQKTLESILASEVKEMVVVVGHEHEKIKTIIQENKYPVKIAENKNYRLGMTSSIQAGLEFVSEFADGFMICMADMPLLETSHYNSIILGFRKSYLNNPNIIVIPFYDGRRGNPVIFSSVYRKELLNHKEPEGCKGLVEQHAEKVVRVPLETRIRTLDVDRNEDYLTMV